MIRETKDQSLLRMNTFGMDVRCGLFIEYDSASDLCLIDFEKIPKPVMHIGGGSNILFSGDFKGTVLHSAIKFIEPLTEGNSRSQSPVEAEVPADNQSGNQTRKQAGKENHSESGEADELLVRVGSGTVFDDVCAWAASRGLWGAENLSHIPGEAGAAAVQNIGAYGVEFADLVRSVECFDTLTGKTVNFPKDECGYGYRESMFKRPGVKGRYIVTSVTIALSRTAGPLLEYGNVRSAVDALLAERSAESPAVTPAIVREAIIGIRKAKLPEVGETGSAGSFFRNPVVPEAVYESVCRTVGTEVPVPHYVTEAGIKIPAAWLIDRCGWKGVRKGNAGVHDKQPLVIVNATGKAAPGEIIALKDAVAGSVKDRFGIDLVPEVEII
jgi:UDP-N-acetylmuramate dehydrogenase